MVMAVQSASQPAGLLRLGPAQLRVTGRITLSGAPVGLVFGHGTLWILSAGHDQLLGIDPVTMLTVSRLPLPSHVTALAYGDGALWVTVCCTRTPDGHRLRLVRIDPATGRVTSSGGLPGSGSPASLAVGRSSWFPATARPSSPSARARSSCAGPSTSIATAARATPA